MVFLFLGLFIDAKKIIKPNIRIFFQLLLVFAITYYYDLQITSTRVILFDDFLKYKLLNYIFVCFCILVLINGTNFIDGLNGLVIGYYLIILFFLYKNNFIVNIIYSYPSIVAFFYIFLLLYFFNIFNKLYLGDSGI